MGALDFTRYFMHRVKHRSPWLWRIHRMHHTEHSLNVTSSLRFHPPEVAVSWVFITAAAITFGIPPASIVIHYTLLMFSSHLAHSNFRLPEPLDRILRAAFVTPGTHRIHHSNLRRETDSNYGDFLTVWDRLLGTYQPPRPPLSIQYGLEEFRDSRHHTLRSLLATPFLP